MWHLPVLPCKWPPAVEYSLASDIYSTVQREKMARGNRKMQQKKKRDEKVDVVISRRRKEFLGVV